MGIRDAIGDRWARFRAYLHSIPPHVWLGLIIGAIALVLAYLAWKNRNQSLSSLSPLSQLSPLSDTTTTTTPGGSPVTLPAVPDLGNLLYPPGQYYNYQTQKPVVQMVPASSAPAFNKQIGYDIQQQSLVAKAQAAAASLLQSASAPLHSQDIHQASANLTAVKAAQNTAVYNFQQGEIASQALTPKPVTYGPIPTARPVIPAVINIPHPLAALQLNKQQDVQLKRQAGIVI